MRQAEIQIDILRHDAGWPADADGLIITAVQQARQILKLQIAGPAELSIVLTNDHEQQMLNAEWRQKDGTTNVLSFPQIAPFGKVTGLLGDIVLARETVEREAGELGKPFAEHLTHLVVHGFLHILGYDHINDQEARQMERLESDILASLEIADPYADG